MKNVLNLSESAISNVIIIQALKYYIYILHYLDNSLCKTKMFHYKEIHYPKMLHEVPQN